jgi:hypothetical protein
MFATFLQKANEFPGLPDSLFELNDPARVVPVMQRESKHSRFLRQLNFSVNKFECRSAAIHGQGNCLVWCRNAATGRG